MPHRPSKKPKVRPGQNAGPTPEQMRADKASQQRHMNMTTKAILGKFQGRKSI